MTDFFEDERAGDQREQRRSAQREAYWEAALSTEAGQEVLFEMMVGCGVFASNSATHVSELSRIEARRAVGLDIQRQFLRHNPDAYNRRINAFFKPKETELET